MIIYIIMTEHLFHSGGLMWGWRFSLHINGHPLARHWILWGPGDAVLWLTLWSDLPVEGCRSMQYCIIIIHVIGHKRIENPWTESELPQNLCQNLTQTKQADTLRQAQTCLPPMDSNIFSSWTRSCWMLLRRMQGCKSTWIHITGVFCIIQCTITCVRKTSDIYLKLLTSYKNLNLPFF